MADTDPRKWNSTSTRQLESWYGEDGSVIVMTEAFAVGGVSLEMV